MGERECGGGIRERGNFRWGKGRSRGGASIGIRRVGRGIKGGERRKKGR